MKLEVLKAYMDEKVYQVLRTQKQLGYCIYASKSDVCGILGLSLIVQSAEYSPVYLEEQILEFIDTFYTQLLDEATFENYKKGVLEKKKSGYSDFQAEADDLLKMMRNFISSPNSMIDWAQREKEVQCLEEYVTFQECKRFYEVLFAPTGANQE